MAISFLSEDGALPRSLFNRKRITLPQKTALPTASVELPAAQAPSSSGYTPDFGVGKSFKSIPDLNIAALQGYITPSFIDNLAKARPEMFAGISDPGSLITPSTYEGESGPQQLFANSFNLDPQLQQILSGMRLERRGAAGVKDGRTNALYDAQGNLVYADTPYSYDPAGDTLKSAMEAAALSAAAFGGIGLAGHGPLAGVLGGSSAGAGGAAAGTGAGGGAIATGGAQGAAALEAAVAADIAAAQAAAAGSVGAGAGLTAAELAALGVGGAGAAGAGAGLATLPAQATGAITPTAAQTLPMTAGVGAVPTLAGATGTSAIDKVLSAIGTAGSNLVNKAIENPLQTAALVGSVGALAGAKPSGTPSFNAEEAAAAQGEANREASWFDAVLNRPDMETPWGSSTWTLREGADPKNPKPGDWVNTVALNEEQQGLLDAQNRLSAGYASTAEGMLGRVQDTYGKPLDLSSLGALPDFGALNTDNDRARIEAALLARLEPQLQQEEERARTRLLNTGFEYGSEGSNIELDRLARGRNDARLAAIAQAGSEASRLMGDQRANLLAALQGRQQGFQELSYERNLPLNELNAFRQGSQVQAPEFQSIIPTNTAASPELDALLAQLGVQQGNAANSQAGYNALLQAIAGLGSAWIGG